MELLGTIAGRKWAALAQVALAWILAPKPWCVPIPGTTKLHRLEENVGATAVALTDADPRGTGHAASRITAQRERYPEAAQRMISR